MSNTTARRNCTHETPVKGGVIICNAPARAGRCTTHKQATPAQRLDVLEPKVDRILALLEAGAPAKVSEVTTGMALLAVDAIERREAPRVQVPGPAPVLLNERRPLAQGEARACTGCGKAGLIHNTLCGKCRRAAAKA